MSTGIWPRAAVTAVIGVAAFILAACDPGFGVAATNHSERPVLIRQGLQSWRLDRGASGITWSGLGIPDAADRREFEVVDAATCLVIGTAPIDFANGTFLLIDVRSDNSITVGPVPTGFKGDDQLVPEYDVCAQPADLGPTMVSMDASGLGPCTVQWYATCNYGIRVEGPDAYDHRGNFAWDEGVASPGPERAHGPNGPVNSIGVIGDVPATLSSGEWTISFRLWYGSDAIQLVPVPSGTPRLREEDPFTAACSTTFDTAHLTAVALHVAFDGSSCTVETVMSDVSGAASVCGGACSPATSRPPAAALGALALPSVPNWDGFCAMGVGLDLVLHGSASDPKLAWGVGQFAGSAGHRTELLWPDGYVAEFNPALVVLDASGDVVASEGDLIIGTCVPMSQQGALEEPLRIGPRDVRPPTWQPGDG